MWSHPSPSIARCGRVGHLVVAVHHEIAARAQLAHDAAGDRLAGGGVDDPHLGLRERAADRGRAIVEAVVEPALGDHRRALGLAVDDREAHAEPVLDALDQVGRDERAARERRAHR